MTDEVKKTDAEKRADAPNPGISDKDIPVEQTDNLKKDSSIDKKDGGHTDQHQKNAASIDQGAPVPGTLPARANQHIRNTKEAGHKARDYGQEPNLEDTEANMAYRYVEPAFPPSEADIKKK